MTELNRAGVDESLGHLDTTQGEFREQIDVVADELRQLAGNADIPDDPLSAPYVLYVNGYTGSDTFVGGDYQATATDIERRISLQKLECGYSEARPFRTINRAAIEAAIITSRSWFTTDAQRDRALISIVVAPGEYRALNGNGLADTDANFPARTDGFEPTDAQLESFNDDTTGGIILPRGASLVSLDLRKSVIRPGTVPAVANEAADYSNRRSIFKVTGTGYYYGFTFKDGVEADGTFIERSHHLLSTFEFTPQAQLDTLYSKVLKSFAAAGITAGNTVSREFEWQIVGPQPDAAAQEVDTVGSASPYIYNTSIRSVWGLCGIFANGANAGGFRSMVVAQYTGVSLQRDLSTWQRYDAGAWGAITYPQLLQIDPDDIRPHPLRRSFHIRCVNDAVIQEVSVFAIGQAIHHWTESGGEITITNSNSNFGGCAALADGFKSEAAPIDGPWTIQRLRRALDPFQKSNNVRKIFLGTVDNANANRLVLNEDLDPSAQDEDQPEIVYREGYTLKDGDFIWIENPLGADYRSDINGATPWNGSDTISIDGAFVTDNADGNLAPGADETHPAVANLRVYVRRLRDVRTVDERTYSVILTGGNQERLPVRDYVPQPTAGADWTARISAVTGSAESNIIPNTNCVKSELRYSHRPDAETDFDAGTYYRKGDVIRRSNKHLVCSRETFGAFDADDWEEIYVHMEEAYNSEGYYKSEHPIINFDGDTDQSEASTTMGFTINTAVVQAQIVSAVDYQGLRQMLRNLGRTDAQVTTHLAVQTAANRIQDVSGLGFGTIEMRRPSNMRLFGHAYEWAGFGNYSKALPQYQGTMTPANKFSYYFTNQRGGKVYASGFNEEGLAVSPRGLEDITTGDILDFENISGGDTNFTPTFIENLTVDNLTINNSVTGLPEATTTVDGIGDIASAADLRNAEVPGGTDAQIDATLNDRGANFVTVAGLNYWKSENNLLSARAGVLRLYVAPDDADDGDSVSFNGGAAVVLAADPRRSAANVQADPPTTPAKAVHFDRAVAYANDVLSELETARYDLANGPYWRAPGSFGHIAQVVGATSQFPNTNVVANYDNANTRPTTRVDQILANFSAPIFATGAYLRDTAGSTNRLNLVTRPVQLVFNKGGLINGCCWLGVEATFANVTRFPNGNNIFYGIGTGAATNNLETGRVQGANFQNVADARMAANANASSLRFDRYYGRTTIAMGEGSLVVRNCVFGAKAANHGSVGYGETGPIVRPGTDCRLSFSGIYLYGNVIATAATWNSATAAGVTVTAGTVTGRMNCGALVDGYTSTSRSMNIGVQFPAVAGHNSANGRQDRNLDVNCVHVLNNNGFYGRTADDTSNTGTAGAAMEAIIGRLPPGSQLFTGGYNSWRTGFLQNGATGNHGFAGRFGQPDTDKTWGLIGEQTPTNYQRFASYNDSVWQMARDGQEIGAGGTATPAAGTSALAYVGIDNPLNIRSRVFAQGLDVNTASQNGRTFYG